MGAGEERSPDRRSQAQQLSLGIRAWAAAQAAFTSLCAHSSHGMSASRSDACAAARRAVVLGTQLCYRGGAAQGATCKGRHAEVTRQRTSTVGPHQMRKPGGAERYAPMSSATCERAARGMA